MSNESPNQVHGRLMESAHLTGYTAGRACRALEWLLEEDRWKEVGDGYDDIHEFMATVDLSDFRMVASQRKSLAKKLQDLEVSQRATAKALGVGVGTVNRDVSDSVPNGTKKKDSDSQITTKQENKSQDKETSVPNGTPPNPLSTSGAETEQKVAKEATKQWDKAQLYGHDQGDEWYTPQWLFESLGLQFSIDVCAPRDLTHVTTPADQYYSEDDDGLSQVWDGTIWCNPPYSAPEPWADKCIDHRDGLLLTHIPMNAAWAQRVWMACDGIRLFQAIEFVRPSGEKQRPGSWLMLAAFGDRATNALRQLSPPQDVSENPRRVPSPMWVRARVS